MAQFFKQSNLIISLRSSLLLLLFVLVSCRSEDSKYVMATSSKSATYYRIGKIIKDVFDKETDFEIELLYGDDLSTKNNCKMMLEGKVDLALIQNDTPIDELIPKDQKAKDSKLRSILPIYPEIIYIIYPDSLNPKSLIELISGKRIGIGPSHSGTARFMKQLFASSGLTVDVDYHPIYTGFDDNYLDNDSIDVSCAVTGFNNERIKNMIEVQHGKIFSLDDYNLFNKGSVVEGFCMRYPRARPFIIPKHSYGREPEMPVLTLAIDAVLITNSNISDDKIYDFLTALFDKKQLLVNEDPIMGSMTDEIDQGILNFPLHPGAKMYFERNKPSFFERYAEMIGVLFSIFVVLIGTMGTFKKYVNSKKKNRIDEYYNKIIAVDNNIVNMDKIEELANSVEYIRKIKKVAFSQLVSEKLIADESFRIFISLANDTTKLIEDRISSIKSKTNNVKL